MKGTETSPAERFYHLAGLIVRSQLPLPAPLAVAAPHDVDIVEGDLPRPAGSEGQRMVVVGEENDLTIRWPGALAMRVEGGHAITVAREDGADEADAAPFIIGVGMGLLLHQRGLVVLHASAVALPSGAVGFVGWKGAGKSTAAGSLIRRGHPIITDDALPLDVGPDHPVLALPGPAPLKLWPESATALGRSPRRLPRLHRRASKRVIADLPKTEGAIPLRAIYILAVGERVEIEPVAGSAAILELMRHAYAPRFLPAAGATRQHFERFADLARRVPVFRLLRPGGLEILDDIASVVEAHAATVAAEG